MNSAWRGGAILVTSTTFYRPGRHHRVGAANLNFLLTYVYGAFPDFSITINDLIAEGDECGSPLDVAQTRVSSGDYPPRSDENEALRATNVFFFACRRAIRSSKFESSFTINWG